MRRIKYALAIGAIALSVFSTETMSLSIETFAYSLGDENHNAFNTAVDKYIYNETDFKNMFECQYPKTFKSDRDKVFAILKDYYDGRKLIETTMGQVPGGVDVRLEKDYYITSLKDGDYVYYGDMKNNRPHGYGVLVYSGSMIAYGGKFKDGKPNGYGIRFLNGPQIIWECDQPKFKKGDFEAGGNGILYYTTDNSNLRSYYREDIFSEIIQYHNDLKWEFSEEEVKVYPGQVNYLDYYQLEPLVLKPAVKYEGKLKGETPEGKGKLYYDYYYTDVKYQAAGEDLNKSNVSHVGDDTPYGHINYDGEFKNGLKSGKGKLYYFNGNLYYDGEYKNGKMNGKGTLYNADGSVKYKGKFKNDDIA